MTQPLLQAADIRRSAQLSADAVAGLTSLVKAMQARAVAPARHLGSEGASVAERTRSDVGAAHVKVRAKRSVVGRGSEGLLEWLAPVLNAVDARQRALPEHESVLAALNGVLGDQLATSGSALAIKMQFRHSGRPLQLDRHALSSRLGNVTPKLLVLLHGMCMNDLQWQQGGHDHGQALAREFGYTPIYLHYNSGLSVSTNGRILANLMESLYSAWPVPVERLVMMGHGMGGLVARSAIHHGPMIQRGELRWPGRVDDLICLGTPHQGTALECSTRELDLLLSSTPYVAALSQLGKVHSAGASDLRLGNILKGPSGDDGSHRCDRVRLPDSARCFAVAASLDAASSKARARMKGDGLVPVASALGQHNEPDSDLNFAPERQLVVQDSGHLDLLSSARVYALLQEWLG